MARALTLEQPVALLIDGAVGVEHHALAVDALVAPAERGHRHEQGGPNGAGIAWINRAAASVAL